MTPPLLALRERQVGPAQLVGDLVGVIAGVGEAEAAVTHAAIDHVALLLRIDAYLVHVGVLSK